VRAWRRGCQPSPARPSTPTSRGRSDRAGARTARRRRIDSTIAGVPASSRISAAAWYVWTLGLTKRIVPPPGTVGVRFAKSPRFATSTPSRAGTADELVCQDEDRVLTGEVAVLALRRRVHVDRLVRRGRGIVEARERAVTMEGDRDRVDVGDDPGHARGRREAADLRGTLACRRSSCSRCSRSTRPLPSSRIVTTSAIDSRHGSSFEWCSYGPTKTTGRRRDRIRPSRKRSGSRRPSTCTSFVDRGAVAHDRLADGRQQPLCRELLHVVHDRSPSASR
jgi:hypothetical protein